MTAVELRIYDLSGGMCAQMSAPLLGQVIEAIPHCGVVVFGLEYFYGGGIRALRVEEVEAAIGRRPYKIEQIGKTSKTKSEFEAYLKEEAHQWTAEKYDLWRRNCNDFADFALKFLTEKSIPQWIRDLPAQVLATPVGAMLEGILSSATDSMNAKLEETGGSLNGLNESEETISITVKSTADQKGKTVSVPKKGTVADLRKASGLVDESIRIVFKGKVLKSQTLEEAGLIKDGLVVLYVPKSGKEETEEQLVESLSNETLKTVSAICSRVIDNPTEAKYRKLKMANATFQRKVLRNNDGKALRLLQFAGFAEKDEILSLEPSASAWVPLNKVKSAVDKEINKRGRATHLPTPALPGLSMQQMAQVTSPAHMRQMVDMMAANPELARMAGPGFDTNQTRHMINMLQANPHLQTQVEETMRRMMTDPTFANQMMQLAARNGGPAGFGAAANGFGGAPFPPSMMPPSMMPPPSMPPPSSTPPPPAPAGGVPPPPAARPSSNNMPEEALTEEEQLMEAIRRSLREQ